MRLIDADAFKKYIIKGFKEMKSQFKTEFYLDIATRVTESFLEDINEQPTVEAQPTDAVSRTLVHEAITASIAESENPYEMWQRIETLPSVTPQIEPCEDCISRAEVGRILGNEVFELMKLHTVNPEDNPKADAMSYGVNWSLNTLMELPSVTPQRPKGKWIPIRNYQGLIVAYKCSKCEKTPRRRVKSNYCPNCGAEMSGGGEDADSD